MEKPKILLIHGWNHMNYTSTGCVDAWADRARFTSELSKFFLVVPVSLPGFGSVKDPETPWDLDAYTKYVDGIIKSENPDYILGYSFGGAIVLHWKRMTDDVRVKAFLVSPAIIRRYREKDLGSVQKIFKAILPDVLISLLRDLYLTKIRKNPYYSKATKVMRKTYRNIVAVDLRNDLLEVRDKVTLIFGDSDTATPVDLVKDTISQSRARHTLHVISHAGHDIANTNTEELVSFITRK
jgi:pimeloyl-ACP methyl ester carboxylesterase